MKAKKDASLKLFEEKVASLARTVLKDVKPSENEAKTLTRRINEVIGRLKILTPKTVEIIVAGSLARNTNMSGDSDIDIFLLFDRKTRKENMEKKALDIGKEMVKGRKSESYEIKYAEHPYTRLFLADINMRIDLVPAYKISSAEDIGTAVDRTQLHNIFINSKLNEKQKDEVRVLKAFLKAHNIYGAEAKTEGFSGYLCELLVCHYGSFAKVIANLSNVKPPLAIDIIHNSGAEAVKKFGKNLIVIDPTDKNRNVAANVSEESFARFVLASRKLFRTPNKDTFYGKGHSEIHSSAMLSKIQRSLQIAIYAISFETEDISDEIIWQQVKKLRFSMSDTLSKNGFRLIISLQETEPGFAVICFMINDSEVGYRIAQGPSALMQTAAGAFMKAHANAEFVFLQEDRIYAVEKSKMSKPEDCIRWMLFKGGIRLPSHVSKDKIKLYKNKIPEKHAKLLYRAYMQKTTI